MGGFRAEPESRACNGNARDLIVKRGQMSPSSIIWYQLASGLGCETL